VKTLSARSSGLLLLALLALAGCGSEGVASLAGSIEKPTLEVDRSVLGGDVSGGFELMFVLGDYASGPTEVSLGAFVLERDGMEVLSPLPLSGATFPVTVGVGETKRIPLTFETTAELSVADSLCAGPSTIRGSVSDSLGKNRPTTLTSSTVTPSCTGP
jgi:hypothetical protein